MVFEGAERALVGRPEQMPVDSEAKFWRQCKEVGGELRRCCCDVRMTAQEPPIWPGLCVWRRTRHREQTE